MSQVIFSRTYKGDAWSSWQVAHEMSVRVQDGSLIVSDTKQHNWHLLRLQDSAFLFRIVSLKCSVKFRPDATANFYVHHYGAIDVAEISADGSVVNNGISRTLSVSRISDGVLEIDVTFLSCHSTLSIGSSSNRHPVYAGTGCEQFEIVSVLVETYDASPELSRTPGEERITLVDVGGQGGLQLKWMLKADQITPVVVEPITAEAATIRQTLGRIPGGLVIEKALAHTSGVHNLHITADTSCSSLREPDLDVLERYSIAHIFAVVGTQDVECVRYDDLFRRYAAPSPDVLKIDVQGFEYEVLLGFGHLLENCLAIEMETHVVPIYKGQKLLGDIIDLLSYFGFSLRQIKKIPNFDGDAVEFDVLFMKRRDRMASFSELTKRKFNTIADVLGLEISL